jgi:peptidoglycan/LPS O-acetylase OafA/YrhL
MNKRLYGLDLLRIIAVILVIGKHIARIKRIQQ